MESKQWANMMQRLISVSRTVDPNRWRRVTLSFWVAPDGKLICWEAPDVKSMEPGPRAMQDASFREALQDVLD